MIPARSRYASVLATLLAALLCAGTAVAQANASQVQDALAQAQRLKAAGDKAGAMAAYRQALQLDPRNAIAHNDIGTLYYGDHQVEQAIDEFKQAVQSNPSYALAFFNLGYAARKANRCPEAVPAYQRYAQLQPNDPDGLWGLAECLRLLGQNLQAANVYDAYARLETRSSEARYKQEAISYAQQLRLPAAPPQAAAPQPAPAPQPQAAPMPAPVAQSPSEPYLARGDALFAQNPRDALYAYQDGVRAEPNSPKAHFKVAVAYAQLGYFPQAIEEWNNVLRIDPNGPGAASARDNIQKAQARMAAAQAQAAQAAPPPVTDPAQAQELVKQSYDQAVQLIQQRRYAEAVTTLTSAIQVKPDFAVAFVARGSAMVGLGRFQDAVQDYLHGLSLNSNQAAPLFGLGEAYRGMGDRARAAQYYQECADSSAPDAGPLRDLARRRFSELVQ
jgi:tetratricopeptide (TPR) repeat protein